MSSWQEWWKQASLSASPPSLLQGTTLYLNKTSSVSFVEILANMQGSKLAWLSSGDSASRSRYFMSSSHSEKVPLPKTLHFLLLVPVGL